MKPSQELLDGLCGKKSYDKACERLSQDNLDRILCSDLAQAKNIIAECEMIIKEETDKMKDTKKYKDCDETLKLLRSGLNQSLEFVRIKKALATDVATLLK